MSLAAQVVRANAPQPILDLGSGLGYSTLWLARAAPDDASVLGIDRDGEHVALAEQLAGSHGLARRVAFLAGEVADVLEELNPTVDFVHDDAWFASKPSHFERVMTLLRPGGVLTMPNWFLLEDAIGEPPRRDWSQFAGVDWREAIGEFARLLAQDDRLQPVWVTEPPLLIAIRS